jgi:hypothetical protein
MQHTKTLERYHGLCRDRDAIVIGAFKASDAFRGLSLSCSAHTPVEGLVQNGGLQYLWPRG